MVKKIIIKSSLAKKKKKKKLVSTATINWHQTNLSSLYSKDDTSLYAFTRGTNLLYIGLANKQHITNEVKQTFQRINEAENGLVVWLGYLTKHNGDELSTKDTHQLIKDIECLLIYKNQPSKNIQCKKNYTGRRPLMVVNEQCSFLIPKVAVRNTES